MKGQMLPAESHEAGPAVAQNLGIIPHEMQRRTWEDLGNAAHELWADPCFHVVANGDDHAMIVLTPQLVAAFAALLPGLAALVWAVRRKP